MAYDDPDDVAQLRALYLDLIKRSLLDLTHLHDPLAAYDFFKKRSETSPAKLAIVRALDRVLAKKNFRLVHRRDDLDIATLRETGLDWPARAHTMIGRKRLDNLHACIEQVLADQVPGDFIETGVWRGGACIFMRAALKAYGERERTVWLADSFQGLPPPDAATYAADAGDTFHMNEQLGVSRREVEQNFAAYGLLDGQVRFIEGWFKDTLATAPVERLAILRLDGDMYESTIQAIEPLYPKLSPGGFCIVDDFFLEPCARAISDYRQAHGITEPIIDIDGIGAYWRKAS